MIYKIIFFNQRELHSFIFHIISYLNFVQIYDLSYIYLHHSHSTGIVRTHKVQLPDALIAQSVEHCTGFQEVMGFSSFNFTTA